MQIPLAMLTEPAERGPAVANMGHPPRQAISGGVLGGIAWKVFWKNTSLLPPITAHYRLGPMTYAHALVAWSHGLH